MGQVVVTGLGDVDGDGRVDACFWTAGGEFSVQSNAGFGRFEALPGSLPSASLGQEFTRFALDDLDGDGLLDLIVVRGVSGPGVTEVLLGDGAGGFTLAAAFDNDYPFNRAADDLELIDLDGGRTPRRDPIFVRDRPGAPRPGRGPGQPDGFGPVHRTLE